jgi:hypothetical protein
MAGMSKDFYWGIPLHYDKCEKCGCIHTSGDCDRQWTKDTQRLNILHENGHTNKCAIRQVLGDGECECHVEGKGDGLPDDFPRFHKLMEYGE